MFQNVLLRFILFVYFYRCYVELSNMSLFVWNFEGRPKRQIYFICIYYD